MTSLVLHADDFGLNASVTRGIVAGFRDGLLTSTSLLVNAPAAELAIDEWHRLEELRRSDKLNSNGTRRRLDDPESPFDLGMHLNLTQGRPLTGRAFPKNLLDSAGRFLSPGRLFFQLATGGPRWRRAVGQELATQMEWLIDRGLRPTHINGHQYIEMMPVVSKLVPRLAQRYAVPYIRAACEPRHWHTSLYPGMRLSNWCLSFIKQYYARRWGQTLDAAGITHADAFFGASHAGRIDLRIVRRFLATAQKHVQCELAFHPGHVSSDRTCEFSGNGWCDPLALARPAELRLLCSPALADLIASEGCTLGRLKRPEPLQSIAA